MNDDDDSEVIIGDDDSEDVVSPVQSSDSEERKTVVDFSGLLPYVQIFNNNFPNFNASIQDNMIKFQIPRMVLPLSLQMVCGFHLFPVLVYVELYFKEMSWTAKLEKFSVKHPIYGKNYVGRALVEDAIRMFFSESYKQTDLTRAISYLFGKNVTQADPANVSKLVKMGFKQNLAEKALIKSMNNLKKAKDMLINENVEKSNIIRCPLKFNECINAFLDLNDHCCICRKELKFSGIKPTVCDNKLCQVGFNEIGVGTSVVQEIRRDPLAADWILTIYGCALRDTRYLVPMPPVEILDISNLVLKTLPPMEFLANSCTNDADLSKTYGKNTLDFLRWVLLTNKSQIISLPEELSIKSINSQFQFMTLISSPDLELEFLKRKEQYGSYYLWHGSAVSRWYSIVQNGLKNMSRIRGGVVHGTAYGEGIYFSSNSNISFQYTDCSFNPYVNSVLGRRIKMIGFCEVAKMPKGILNNFNNNILTLIDEKACIVRYVFVIPENTLFHFISTKFTDKKLPNLNQVLDYLSEKALSSK